MNSAASHGKSTAVAGADLDQVIESAAAVELGGNLAEFLGGGDTDELAAELCRQRAHRAAGAAADVEHDVVGGDLRRRRQPQCGGNSEHVDVIDGGEHVGREVVDVVPGRRHGARMFSSMALPLGWHAVFRRRPHRQAGP